MGAELQVTVSASGYGGFGLLQETLPEGFTLVATALDAATVKVEGQTVTFTLLGVELVTYTVAAPTTEGQYDFSGFLLDMQKQEAIVAGASSVRVGPEPTATPTPAGAHHHAETHGHAKGHGHARPDADPRSAAHVDVGGGAVGDAHALAHGNGNGTRHARGNRCSGGSRR